MFKQSKNKLKNKHQVFKSKRSKADEVVDAYLDLNHADQFDPNGSWNGRPDSCTDLPEQDADDL